MELFDTYISPESVRLVNDVLKSTFVSEGNLVEQFEKELENRLSLIKPVAVNSGTSALHLSLASAGIKQGDEVILPAQTFVATGLAILMQGAKPVFADIDYFTGNISPESIREKITPKTRAIMPVHWAGYPCNMDEISEIAKEHNLIVIEDAAHALGAIYKERFIGTISDYTCFSFQAIKHLTTGDGGAVCCLHEKDYQHCRKLRWFGIDRKADKPDLLGERVYDLTEIGYKYHMNNIAAAIGLGNLYDFPDNLKRRRNIAEIYQQELKNIPGLTLLKYEKDIVSSYWLFTILVEDRNNFIKKLKEVGIPASVIHLRIDKNTVFGGINEDLINQKKFDIHQVSIPLHYGLSAENINVIIDTIKEGW